MKLYNKLYYTLTATIAILGISFGTFNANAEEPKEDTINYSYVEQEEPIKKPIKGINADQKQPEAKPIPGQEKLNQKQDDNAEPFEKLRMEYNSAATCRERAQTIALLVTSDPGRKFMEERIDNARDLEEMMAIAAGFMDFVDAPLDKGLPLSSSYYKSLHSKFLMRFAHALYREEQKLDAEAKAEAYNNRPWCQDHDCYVPKKNIYMVHRCKEFLFQPVDCKMTDRQFGPYFNLCKDENHSSSEEFTALCPNFECGFELKSCGDNLLSYSGCTSITCKPDFEAREYVCDYYDLSYPPYHPPTKKEAARNRAEYKKFIEDTKKLHEERDQIKRDH